MNIVSAIRDLPDPVQKRGRRRQWVGTIVLILLGVLLAVSGVSGKNGITLGLGVSLLIFGLARVLRHLGLNERAVRSRLHVPPGRFGSRVSLPRCSAPSAPPSVVAAAGDGWATVGWQAPDSNGGSVIRFYTVTSNPGGSSVTVGGFKPARRPVIDAAQSSSAEPQRWNAARMLGAEAAWAR